MRKLLVLIVILVIMSSPVFAFSIKDFIMNFQDIFVITGNAAPPPISCTEGEERCGTDSECDGNPCVMSCSSGTWIESQYCMEICSEGQCTTANVAFDSGGIPQNQETLTQDSSTAFQPIEPTTCSDGTLYEKCSITKPKFCSNGILKDKCNECGCPEGKSCQSDETCIEQNIDPGGQENNNPEDLNIAPIITSIENKILRIDGSIQFRIIATDANNDVLTYQLGGITIARCSILGDAISCIGLTEGTEALTITASDGIDIGSTVVSITVLPTLHEPQPGVAAGLTNNPPVANAGPDIEGISGQEIILDASLSYDEQGLLSLPETYKWYKNENIIGTGKVIEKIFSLETHIVTLTITDSEGLTDEDSLTITIKEKQACKNTQTVYFPEDTPCNNKWPIPEGDEFKINSETAGACSLFEVCSEDIDYIIKDSITCCTEGLTDADKVSACNFANENSETFRNCQATYIIKSLGRAATYIKEYFDAEMCCKGVGALCPNEEWLYTPQPLPENLKGVKCSNTPENNPNGVWKSDTNLGLNEIALFDAPAHSTLNIIKSGTCVDYSVAATTLLRKIGFSSDQAMTVEASDHAYNLVRFNLDRKYTIFDMTGNNEGLKRGKVPQGYDYCENIINCYNDLGKISCPSNKEINGCENTKERIGRTAGRQVGGIGTTIQGFWERLWQEITR